jgi:hypothetical protein
MIFPDISFLPFRIVFEPNRLCFTCGGVWSHSSICQCVCFNSVTFGECMNLRRYMYDYVSVSFKRIINVSALKAAPPSLIASLSIPTRKFGSCFFVQLKSEGLASKLEYTHSENGFPGERSIEVRDDGEFHLTIPSKSVFNCSVTF